MGAISIKADYLITGDSTLFGKYFGQTVNGVKICRPRDYLAKLLRKKKKIFYFPPDGYELLLNPPRIGLKN
jgi:hypothetical protein